MTTASVLRTTALGLSTMAFGLGLLTVVAGGTLVGPTARGILVPSVVLAPFVFHVIYLVAQCVPHGSDHVARPGTKGSDHYMTAFLLCMLIPYDRLGRLADSPSMPDWGGIPLALLVAFLSLLVRVGQLWILRGHRRGSGTADDELIRNT